LYNLYIQIVGKGHLILITIYSTVAGKLRLAVKLFDVGMPPRPIQSGNLVCINTNTCVNYKHDAVPIKWPHFKN